tara:strand:- start:247 stop:606 length:360 start_codon:yes stop_codon:yes gene_type:complete
MPAAIYDIEATKGSTLNAITFKFVQTKEPLVLLDLTGWLVRSEVRRKSGGDILLDLAPVISDAINGEVTIQKTDEEMDLIREGIYKWDLILEDSTGQVFPPYIGGGFTVSRKITDSDNG